MQFNNKKGLLVDFQWRNYVVYIAFVLVFLFFAITLKDDGFLTSINLMNIIKQTTTISIMAVAMALVISTGEIDLSVGSIAAIVSLTTALAIKAFGIVPAIAIGIVSGSLFGLINGVLVTYVMIPSFLVTLGMMGVWRGVAMWMTETKPVPILNQTYNNIFGSGSIGPIPVLFLWTILALIIGHVLLRKTKFGRQVLATGGNEVSARFSGVNTNKIKLLVFTFSGIAAGIGGMLYAGRMQAGRYSFGSGDELSVIAAVILGGTSLFGGVGTVVGAVIGSIMIGMINNGLIIMGLDISQQMIVQGGIIILAVAIGKKKLSS